MLLTVNHVLGIVPPDEMSRYQRVPVLKTWHSLLRRGTSPALLLYQQQLDCCLLFLLLTPRQLLFCFFCPFSSVTTSGWGHYASLAIRPFTFQIRRLFFVSMFVQLWVDESSICYSYFHLYVTDYASYYQKTVQKVT